MKESTVRKRGRNSSHTTVSRPKSSSHRRKSASSSQTKKRPKRNDSSSSRNRSSSTSRYEYDYPAKVKVKPRTPMKKLVSMLWNVIFYLLIGLLVLGAVLFNFNDNPEKTFYGYRFMTVITNSMAPNPDKPEYEDGFVRGDIVILHRDEPETLKEGDIITFYPMKGSTDSFLTHRLVKISKELDGEEGLFFTTQGDANSGADAPIDAKQYVGKVIYHVPHVGKFLDFIRNNIVIVAIFIATLFGFSVTLKYYLAMNDLVTQDEYQRKRR